MKIIKWFLSILSLGLCLAGFGAIINGHIGGGLITIVWGVASLLWSLSAFGGRSNTDDFIDKYVG